MYDARETYPQCGNIIFTPTTFHASAGMIDACSTFLQCTVDADTKVWADFTYGVLHFERVNAMGQMDCAAQYSWKAVFRLAIAYPLVIKDNYKCFSHFFRALAVCVRWYDVAKEWKDKEFLVVFLNSVAVYLMFVEISDRSGGREAANSGEEGQPFYVGKKYKHATDFFTNIPMFYGSRRIAPGVLPVLFICTVYWCWMEGRTKFSESTVCTQL